jgi:hypothetical protein
MEPKELLAEALRLPEDARAVLAGELIESLEGEVDPEAQAARATEIRARLDAGSDTTTPWSEARRRLHAAVGRGSRS